MMFLDLDELDSVFDGRWLWSTSRPALARFRREKHLGDPDRALSDCVRDLVEAESGSRPGGPIRLLTNLQYFGYGFNPVSFYYCYNKDQTQIEAFVAEVNNTPWGEQDTYVLASRDAKPRGKTLWFRDDKKMHVSPFMPMDMQYDWYLSRADKQLTVYMINSCNERQVFSASMRLRRKTLSGRNLAHVLLTYPFMTLKVFLAIHWQALRLWTKKVPVYRHPENSHQFKLQQTTIQDQNK